MGNLCPEDLRARAAADKWMDWSSISLAPFNAVYLDYYFRLAEAERKPGMVEQAVAKATPLLDILDAHLAGNDYLGGAGLTMADFPGGSLLQRWFEWTPKPPAHANVRAYYERLLARPAYREHVVAANAPRTQQVQEANS